MVRHLTSGREPLGQVRDVCIVLAVGGAAGCILSATLGVATLGAGGFIESENFAQVWQTWWMGDTAGVFLGTPLLLAWSRRPSWPDRPAFWQEAACCFGVLIGAAWVVFVVFAGRPLAFIFMPLVVWPAVRFHTRGATAAVLAIAVPAVWGTIHGRGPFAANPRNEALLMLELFLSLVVLTALCVSAIVTGREEARAAKQQAFDELESRVIERTAALVEVNEKLTAEIIERRSAEEALRASESSLALAQIGRAHV